MSGIAQTPGLARRLLCLIYDALLLAALMLFAGGVASALTHLATPDYTRPITRTVVAILCPVYFAWQWRNGGQTLPMKTWRIRLESADGGRITAQQALLRSILATAGYLALCVSVFWVAIDRDGQFLHDRLSGTRLVRSD